MNTHRDRLAAGLRQISMASGIPYVGVALTVAGRRDDVCVAVDGTVNPLLIARHGRFRIGCSMKLLLAILALELASRGSVDLDAPLLRYLPELGNSPKGSGITPAHLLSHTSGYRNFDSRYQHEASDTCEWDEFVDMLRGAAQVFSPGTVFNYQHSESVLMKEILERATGHSFGELLHRVIFAPLALAPGPRAHGDGFDIQGHTFSTPEHRFVKMDTSEVKPKCTFWEPAVSEKTLALMEWVHIAEALIAAHHGEPSPFSTRTALLLGRRTVVIPALQGGRLSKALPRAGGTGSQLFRNDVVGHDSFVEGQTHGLRIDLRRRIAFAVGINADRPFLRLLATDHVMRHLYGPEPTEVAPLTLPTGDLSGVYDCGSSGEAVVGLNGDRLRLTLRNTHSAERSTEHTTLLAIGADGALRDTGIQGALGSPSIAFFRDPSSHRICLMVGTRAFVKT